MKKISIKKIFFGGVLFFLLSGSTFALPSGLYLGAGTGVVVNTDNAGRSFRGMPLTLYGGFGAMRDPTFYLAGELFGNLGTAGLNDNNLRTKQSWGISVIPGIMLNENILGFARIGGLRNWFDSESKFGFELGIGLYVALTREWDLRYEYDYIKYTNSNNSARTDQFALGLIYKIASF